MTDFLAFCLALAMVEIVLEAVAFWAELIAKRGN